MAMRVKLVVAYDGTNYHGWQIQPNCITIESELNRCLSELLGEEIQVIGASRTDTGVHSLGTVAVFDTNTRIPANKISYALNQRLPEDIRIQESVQCADDWHPRHCDSIKTYLYQIYTAPFPMPSYRLNMHYSYHHYDIEAMRKAAEFLIGEHDFKSFCSVGSVAETTVRTIYNIQIDTQTIPGVLVAGREEKEEPVIIQIRVSGNGFLYNMVRIIAGTLMDVGLGKYPPEKIQEILQGKDRQLAGPTAPANGLTLYSYQFLG